MSKVNVKCGCCGTQFQARSADVKRGWGKFCSKSCKAKKQERRTGQMANYLHRRSIARDSSEYGGTPVYEAHGEYAGFVREAAEPWDDHKDLGFVK